MNASKNAQNIERHAAEWVTRSDRGLQEQEVAQLQDWLDSDPRCRGALLKAEAAWALLDRGRLLSGQKPSARWSAAGGRSGLRWAGVLAAAALGALMIWGGAVSLSGSGEDYRTRIGEVRRIALSDGSLAEINTDSRIAVAMEPTRRTVALKEGEAWFEVAKDAVRPFVVEAGEVRVQALGTAFSVRRFDDHVEVVVTEGLVEAWRVGAEEGKLRLSAGARATVESGRLPVAVEQAPAAVERRLAWRSGQVALHGESLAEAVAEFNRYNTRKLVIDDAALASEQLVGWFRTHEPEGFARAVASTLEARVQIDGEQIRIMR